MIVDTVAMTRAAPRGVVARSTARSSRRSSRVSSAMTDGCSGRRASFLPACDQAHRRGVVATSTAEGREPDAEIAHGEAVQVPGAATRNLLGLGAQQSGELPFEVQPWVLPDDVSADCVGDFAPDSRPTPGVECMAIALATSSR